MAARSTSKTTKAPAKAAAPKATPKAKAKAKGPDVSFDQVADRNGLPCYEVKQGDTRLGFVFQDTVTTSDRPDKERPHKEVVTNATRWRATSKDSPYAGVPEESYPTRDAAVKSLA